MWIFLAFACTGAPDDSEPVDTDSDPIETDTDPVDPPPVRCADTPCLSLSEYGLFDGPLAALTPAEGTFRYEVTSPLWADNAVKSRFIQLPLDGGKVDATNPEAWNFPVGAILVKTFSFPTDAEGSLNHLETRLLIRTDSGWTPYTYRWTPDQSDAVHNAEGENRDLTWVDAAGVSHEQTYTIPAQTDCVSCHRNAGRTVPLGAVAEQLASTVEIDGEVVDQWAYLTTAGLFTATPTAPAAVVVDPQDTAATDEQRARGWLYANCAHCHRSGGTAAVSGLRFTLDVTDPRALGICKMPVVGNNFGGRVYDVVPGDPEASILLFRQQSTTAGVQMPPLPNRLADPLGSAILSTWILGLPPQDCAAKD